MDGTSSFLGDIFLFSAGILKKFFPFFGSFFVFCIVASGIYFSQEKLWSVTERHFYELGKNPGYIPTGEQLKPFLLGFDHFVADLYWIRATQYVGGNSGAFEFNSLPEYLDLVTDLNPEFHFAYHFGALLYPLNSVAISRVPELLEKGIRLNQKTHPDSLARFYIDLAFYTYYYQDDFEKGAELYKECSLLFPNCPKYAKNVAAFLQAKTGKHSIALQIWLEKFLEDGDKSEEEVALEQKKIEEFSKLVAITCATEHYEYRFGESIEELSQLLNISVYPCDALSNIPDVLLEKISELYDLAIISQKTLTSPFPHNPFVWDSEKKRVSARHW
jgi:tetratricopeptide (TPR) repeat protein